MENELLSASISIDRSGELVIKSDIIENITRQLCGQFNCTYLNEVYDKVRRQSKIRIKTQAGYYPEVFSVSKGIVKTWTRSMSLVSVPGLYSDLDLEKGKYEGGFKVWESTRDLIKFLIADQSLVSELLHRRSKFRCLELGAGASLPTLALISRMLQDADFNSDYHYHVQDYNWQVLASLTLLNFAVNLPSDYLAALLETKSLRFFYGDWSNFSPRSRHLARRGYIVIATKDTYFGLTGSLYVWLDFVNTKGVFSAPRVIKVSNNNIPRSILIMQKIIS